MKLLVATITLFLLASLVSADGEPATTNLRSSWNCSWLPNCSTCTATAGCGWCNSTRQCMSGNVYGSMNETCPNYGWNFWTTQCPASRHNVTSAPMPSWNCSWLPNCSTCTATAGCGWCNSTRQCMSGNVYGPMNETCPNYGWNFWTTQCPASRHNVTSAPMPSWNCSWLPNCSTCTATAGCGWCNSTRQCMSGNVYGPMNETCPNYGWNFWTTQCAGYRQSAVIVNTASAFDSIDASGFAAITVFVAMACCVVVVIGAFFYVRSRRYHRVAQDEEWIQPFQHVHGSVEQGTVVSMDVDASPKMPPSLPLSTA